MIASASGQEAVRINPSLHRRVEVEWAVVRIFQQQGLVGFRQLILDRHVHKSTITWLLILQFEGPTLTHDESLRFSADNRRLAYVAKHDGAWFVVVNGAAGARYDDAVIPETLRFSPDSQRFAYVARRGQEHFLVVNDQAGPAYEAVGIPEFSPDGRHLAYPARKERRWRVVRDGTDDPPYDAVASLLFSPDSRRLAYVVEIGGRWHVTTDGQLGLAFQSVQTGTLNFSPDSKHLFYQAATEGKVHAVANEILSPPYNAILTSRQFVFENPRTVVFLAERDFELFRVQFGLAK